MLLPSIVESQIRQGIADYLRTTFPITTPHFSRMLDGLIDGTGELFKGPYISLALPFKKGSGDKNFFPKIQLPFPPYMHQELAFARLGGELPKSTLVATGTGSGKTESFLWPILAYCADNAPSQGIKAILIYPMNALATDQAKRIAKTIWKNPNLKGRVTAGLYVGGEEKSATTTMGAETVITDRETLRESPRIFYSPTTKCSITCCNGRMTNHYGVPRMPARSDFWLLTSCIRLTARRERTLPA